jgi:hypothetical protein
MAVEPLPPRRLAPSRKRPARPRPAPSHQQRLFEALAHPLCAREVAELLRVLPYPGTSP